MKINCDTIMDGWLGKPPSGQRQKTECGKPAVIVILTEYEQEECTGPINGDHYSTLSVALTVAKGACAEHAPEEVHEARSSMSEDEYAVVNLPPAGLQHRLVRESAALTEDEIAQRQMALADRQIARGGGIKDTPDPTPETRARIHALVDAEMDRSEDNYTPGDEQEGLTTPSVEWYAADISRYLHRVAGNEES